MSHIVQSLAQKLQKSEATIARYLHCVAEASACGQMAALDDLERYIAPLQAAGCLQPVCLTFRQSYDETQHNLRVAFKAGDGYEAQVSKIFVIESSWTMVLKRTAGLTFDATQADDPSNYLFIVGKLAPALRAADSTNGKGTAGVLATAPRPSARLTSLFTSAVRVAESDEGPPNMPAERLLQKRLAQE
eukprot:6473267-Amphidinium_carterae.1